MSVSLSRWVIVSTFIGTLLASIVGILIINKLPFIPSWQIAKLIGSGFIILIITILSIRWGLRLKNSLKKDFKRLYWMLAGVVGYLLFLFVVWLILLESFGMTYLGGEEIAAQIRDQKNNHEFFVYHLSEFPDGFIATRVAVRRGWLPFERNIFEIKEPFFETEPTDKGLQFIFGTIGEFCFRYTGEELVACLSEEE